MQRNVFQAFALSLYVRLLFRQPRGPVRCASIVKNGLYTYPTSTHPAIHEQTF